MFSQAFRPENVIAQVAFGSVVYGTANEFSDKDYIVVVKDGIHYDDQYRRNDGDYEFHSVTHFQKLLDKQCIIAIEAYFSDEKFLKIGDFKGFRFQLNKPKLYKEFTKRSDYSYRKTEKCILAGDDRIGMKSLFHSLRIIDFGCQVVKHDKIIDFSSCNHYYETIFQIGPDWEWLNDEFFPIYNNLKSEFLKLTQ